MKKITGTSKLYEQVLAQIESMILQGDFQKGDMLPSEKEIMDMTGVSRITVREALKKLGEAGVIETRKGKGSFVLMDRNDLIRDTESRDEYVKAFQHSTQVRCIIEPEVAKLAAMMATDDDIRLLEETLNNNSNDFHKVLVSIIRNPFINNLFAELQEIEEDKNLVNLIEPSEQKTIVPLIKNQHRKIFESIRDRKPEYAYFYTKEHQEFVAEIYEEYFTIFY
mgnify:CR=1 FL=1